MWHFRNSMIALEKPESSGNIFKLGFNNASFWFQIHDIPILVYEPENDKMLGESDEVTMVGLKYDRLLDFCYACCKIGHGIKECWDIEARKVALEGSPTKFWSWLKATCFEKLKTKSNLQGNESSLDRPRSLEVSRETEGDGSVSVRPSSLASCKEVLIRVTAEVKKVMKKKYQETLRPEEDFRASHVDAMCVDGP
ncbi:hypothetical protein Dsin_011406 [Dipteronia sinensis]|uniref:Zinc knuckle CX2CX4HX4C domain-containing protein n=1 Tax=Dipteronia sinensis TaxID=43782 RepID=A0AAE0AU65_9ROSI|nr:hypothetical protein Dsin_011406 [Dipteronia sinensis]